MYDPTIGRFIQPDTIVPDHANPQSLNRYSYVFNSPTNATDPSGNEPNWKLRKLRAGYGHYWKQYNKTWHRGGDSALNQAWQWASKGEAQYQVAQKDAADTAAQNAYYGAARGSRADELGFTTTTVQSSTDSGAQAYSSSTIAVDPPNPSPYVLFAVGIPLTAAIFVTDLAIVAAEGILALGPDEVAPVPALLLGLTLAAVGLAVSDFDVAYWAYTYRVMENPRVHQDMILLPPWGLKH